MNKEKDISTEKLMYQIALTLIPKVGDVLSKNLISYCGGVEEIFKTPMKKLEKIPGIGPAIAKSIAEFDDWKTPEKEIEFIRKNKIKTLFFLDENYPQRLKNNSSAPILLFYKGEADLNLQRMIAVVGTRAATDYGKEITEKLIEELSPYQPTIISGLAYGIDIYAHKSALKNNLKTIGVLGHGLNTIYPKTHRSTAVKMIEQGGLLTEFSSQSDFDKENFPKRNRIVAGMCDCIIVVESAVKGGALITAELGNMYNKDVFAFPGRSGDKFSEGCNYFIKQNKAMLVESAEDIAMNMSWETKSSNENKVMQKNLFLDLDENEIKIVELLKENKNELPIDEITFQSNMNSSSLAATLLNLEFKGVIKGLPGKVFKLL